MISKCLELAAICAGLAGAGLAYILENGSLTLPLTPIQAVIGGLVMAITCWVFALTFRPR